MTATIVLAGLMTLAFALAFSRHGPTSLVTLGLIGLSAYSLPVLLDFQSPFALAGSRPVWIETPADTDTAVLIAWLFFVPTLMLRRRRQWQSVGELQSDEVRRINDYAIVGTLAILAGHFYLTFSNGFLYFAQSREMQMDNYFTLLWKWFIPFTLVMSTITGKKWQQAIVLLGISVLFIRGDRTMLAISLFSAVLTYREMGGSARGLLSPKKLVLILLASILLFVGKPVYLAVKGYFLTGVYIPIESSQFSMALASFEPIGTIYHLTFVIQNNVVISFGDFLASVFGNLLIIPSAFGVNTNLYGDTVTSFVGPGLTYGIAGSYLAHGYSVGGLVGVAAFGMIYGIALSVCDSAVWRSRGLGKGIFILIGSTLAGYVHRNGLDNFGSFVRQIILIAIIVAVLTWLLKLVRGISPSSRPAVV